MSNSFYSDLQKFRSRLAHKFKLKPLSVIDRLGGNPLQVIPETDPSVFTTLFKNAKSKKE